MPHVHHIHASPPPHTHTHHRLLRCVHAASQIIAAIGLPAGSALRTLPAPVRRKLAQAQHIGLGGDISKHLPVLEPVFRHVMEHGADGVDDGTGAQATLGDRNSGISQKEFVGLLSQVCLPAPPPTKRRRPNAPRLGPHTQWLIRS